MDEKKYTELKEVIKKAVPSIMELKHGCYFRWNGDTWFVNCERCDKEFIFAYSCTGDAHDWPDALQITEKTAWNYKYKNFSKEDQEEIEILGRPIRLADVLLASRGKIECQEMGILGTEKSEEEEFLFNACCTDIVGWKLSQDNLDSQSGECKEFLYEILVKGVQ
ncbi:MAG: hypothetical protein WC976_06485 [Caldisericia bacterium]